MKGSLLVTFDDRGLNNRGTPHFLVEVQPNSMGDFISRDLHYTNADNLYSTYLDNNDTVRFTIYRETGYTSNISLIRDSYTNDDDGGDFGIKQDSISGTTQVFTTYDIFTFPISVLNTSYDFEYRIDIGIIPSFNYYSTSRYSCTFLGECSLVSSGNLINNPIPLEIGKFYNDLSGATASVIGIDFQIVPNTGATNTNITVQGYDSCSFVCPQPNPEGRFSLYSSTQWNNNNVVDYVTRKSNLWGQSITSITGISSQFSDAAISGNGELQFFSNNYPSADFQSVGGFIYKSSNSGSTFSNITGVTSGLTRSYDWSGMDISQNGKYVAVTQNWGPYFYSIDSGSTFSFIDQSNKSWVKPFIPDSQPLPMYGLTTEGFYKLDNLSGPFTKLTGATTTTFFVDGGMSQNRQYILLSTSDATTNTGYTFGTLLLSTNSGNTFSTVYTNDYNFPGGKINMSADGQYMYCTFGTATGVLYSSNYGSTWTKFIGAGVSQVNSIGPISVSDTSERQYKLHIQDTAQGPRNLLYYCDNYLSGCTLLNDFTAPSNTGFYPSGFTYQSVVQNKEYLGTEPSYTPLTSPSTPTYGSWYLRNNITFNYTGITSGDYDLSLAGFDVNEDIYNNFDKRLFSIDNVNKVTLTSSTGSIVSPYVYFNNPSVSATTLSQNDYFIFQLDSASGTTKVPRSVTYSFFIDGVLNQTFSQTFEGGGYIFYEPNQYYFQRPYASGTQIPVGTTGKTATLTVDMLFDTLPARTDYFSRTNSVNTSIQACTGGTNEAVYLSGSNTIPVTGLTVYMDIWLTTTKVGNGNYYILKDINDNQYPVRINGSGVITEVGTCPTPTPTPTMTPTPTPTPTPLPPIVYDADALAFLNAAGITNQNTSYAVNELVIGLKNNSLWNKMFAFYPFVGGTATTCKFNLKNPLDTNAAYRLSFVNCTLSDLGLQRSSVSGYARTWLNPVTVNATTGITASVSFGVWTSGGISPAVDIGCSPQNATGRMMINPNDGNSSGQFDAHNYGRLDNTNVSGDNTTGGLCTSCRTSLTSHKIYKNGVNIGTKTVTQDPSFLPNLDFFLLRERSTSQPTDSSPRRISIAFISTGLDNTDNTNLYTVCQAFQTQLGR
jgi:hypothetical protein